MVIYLRGEDDFRSSEALRGFVEAFRKKHDPSGLGIVRLDGERVTDAELQRALATQGLLTSRRLIVVRSLSANKKKDPADLLLATVEAKRLPKDHILIVWESGVPEQAKRVHPLFLALAALPERTPQAKDRDFQERFDRLIGRHLETWVDAAVKARGIRLTPPARGTLIALAGGSLRIMDQELDKLSHFRPKGIITPADVKLFVHAALDANIFDLTDAIGERSTERSLELLERQFLAGAAPLYLVTMLIRHFRILRSVEAAGPSHPATLARTLGLHPFVVSKAVRQVTKFRDQELADLFEAIVDLDQKLKSTSVDPQVELTLFVVAACRTGEGTRQVGG